jgi:hypothetical protein
MRDYLTPQTVHQPQTPASVVEFTNQQVAGNEAAQERVGSTSEAPGFLERLGFGSVGADGAVESPVPEVEDTLSPDRGLSDHLDLLEAPSSIALPTSDALQSEQGKLALPGQVSVSPTGASFTRKSVDENEVLGNATNRVTGGVDVAAGTVRLGGSHKLHGTDGREGKDGFGAFLQAGKDGQVVAGAGAKAGDLGASVQGMVDVGADGELQALGAGVSVEGGGLKVGVNGAIQLGSVDVEGTSVSRVFGSSAGAEGKWGPAGANVGEAWSYGESVTFADEAQAKAYGEALKAGKHARVADLTAEDIQALPEGARSEYVWQASLNGGASVVVKPEAHAQGSQKVDIRKTRGDVVELTVENTGVLGAGVGVDNGFLGTEGSYDLLSEDHATYEVDLADPAQAAAFERFQSTGDRSGLKLVKSEDLSGTRATSKAHGGGLSVTESSERLSGERRDAGGVSDVERGGHAEEGRNSWDVYGALAGAAGLAGDVMGMVPESLAWCARGFDKAEERARLAQEARFGAVGTTNGTQSGQLDVLTRRADGSTLALGEQMVDFDDQRENARFLLDQTDHTTDGADLDASLLPAHGRTDNAWKLETLVHPEGIDNIEDVLASGKSLPCETVEATHAWMAARDAYGASEGGSAELRAVIADAATFGEDAMECAGAMAGKGNVERFLSREGDDVWMSAEEHARLESQIADLRDGAEQRLPASVAGMDGVRADLQRRMDALKSRAEAEVPESLVAMEIGRLERRLAQTEVH